MDVTGHLLELLEEAEAVDERRLAALVGDRTDGIDVVESLGDAGIDLSRWVYLGEAAGPWTTLPTDRGDRLLGRTIPGLVIDAVDAVSPNAIGCSVGAVEGGGLVVLLLDDLRAWVAGPIESDDRYAVVPYEPADVGSRFRRRFVDALRDHRGVSVIDLPDGPVHADGRTQPPTIAGGRPRFRDGDPGADLLRRCVTTDQRRCVEALLDLSDGDVAVVEAHRGRGKSSAAGLAAAGHARAGRSVLVTGPGYRRVEAVFERAREVLGGEGRALTAETGATISYHPPGDIDAGLQHADLALVDEAAALPVHRLAAVLDRPVPSAFLSTVHGYEGTGRGFAVRFRDRLRESGRPVREVRLREPIRYALGDPVETWQFRALLLDARPAPDAAVADADPETVTYDRVDRDALAADDADLTELFGLLVLAHYRTEPDDLVRLLDAPNVRVRALRHGGHPVAVALLAEEGDLPGDWRERIYRGEPIRGHMVPDLLTTQLRDVEAGVPAGLRVLRIATHGAVRSRGLGSRLLADVRDEVADEVDYLSTGYGMTPRLVSFWSTNGFRTVHVGTSRNPRSGEHSAVMIDPTSPAGESLAARHERRLLDRLEGQLTDALASLEAATLVAAAESIDGTLEVDLPPWVWDVIEHADGGPGQVSTAPHGFRRLALAGLLEGHAAALGDLQRDLVVRRILQSHPWPTILDDVDATRGDARQALGSAISTLLARRRETT
ncbi:MAG: tRNA(Met) cytidine acetyltransferase TmcA [Halobacteriales archaeon]